MPDLLVGFFMYPFHGPSAWFVYVLESGIPRKSFNGRIVFFYVKIITSRRKNYFTLIALLIKYPWYTEIYPLHTQTIQYPSKFDGLYLTRNDGQMHRSILFYLHLLISGLHHHFSIQCHHPPLAGIPFKSTITAYRNTDIPVTRRHYDTCLLYTSPSPRDA